MWFDAYAKLAEIEGHPPCYTCYNCYKTARNAAACSNVADVATRPREITPEELARDIFEERAAIREYLGGQSRAQAEAAALEEAAKATGMDPRALKLALARGP